ncbi:isochorismatase family protein [Streptomyces sp. TLI_171]|uniref:isochorismatase family protein n=1 Tax=Streptomyces sp. TLI_171 TaxID=1938859 RepID=UPI000C1A0E67|nr:isochorismatase family protein [Streptomyces sp. TLI_171]RKE02953.1 nicotinamidase-related amidase [Streptomyces sp. TLI_171]
MTVPPVPPLQSTVLVVIDVQAGFLRESSLHVVAPIAELLDAWQRAGGASVVATFENPPGSQYEMITGWVRLRTSEEQALAAELVPLAARADLRVVKSTSSLLKVPGMLETFRAHGWRHAVICGIDTDSCVYDTAVDFFQNSIAPWLVVDACASSGGEEFHTAALLLAKRNLAARLLVTTEDVHRMLTEGAPQ